MEYCVPFFLDRTTNAEPLLAFFDCMAISHVFASPTFTFNVFYFNSDLLNELLHLFDFLMSLFGFVVFVESKNRFKLWISLCFLLTVRSIFLFDDTFLQIKVKYIR